MFIRTLMSAAAGTLGGGMYLYAVRAEWLSLDRPELWVLAGFLILLSGGIAFRKARAECFVAASPLLSVALVMREVFVGAALYANYAVYATLIALFCGAFAARDIVAKRYQLRPWLIVSGVMSGIGWLVFIAAS